MKWVAGVIRRPDEAISMRTVRESIAAGMERRGVRVVDIDECRVADSTVDLFWDHRASGGHPPLAVLQKAAAPVVVTLHGARAFSLPGNEYRSGWDARIRGAVERRRLLRAWKRIDTRRFHFIAVSDYSRRELSSAVGLEADRIRVIHHGVDRKIFYPLDDRPGRKDPYLLHVSQYQPVKNVGRIVEAFSKITGKGAIRLLLVLPGFGGTVDSEHVTIIREKLDRAELARIYREATAFVFPSLHEGFGLPILEAMACGCPVITSNTTACPEIAGNAAILVDPRSTGAIRNAMTLLVNDGAVRDSMREKGLERAARFDWSSAARRYVSEFERAVKEWKAR